MINGTLLFSPIPPLTLSVYNFTCQGVFHLQPGPERKGDDGNAPSDNRGAPNNKEDMASTLAKAGRDAYVCKSVQTKLRHVADYPLTRSKDKAIRWVEGHSLGTEVYAKPADSEVTDGRSNDSRQKNNSNKSPKKQEECLIKRPSVPTGTIQVNVLTVREVPALSGPSTHRQLMNDPFAGCGPLSP